jgi:predicted phage gp36 major capsid-like protein
MDTTTTPAIDPAAASFDLVARQDAAEADIAVLRDEVVEVKARVDRIAIAAQRPALAASPAAPEVKGFVDGYLRRGSTIELKSIVGTVPQDGGYAVVRQIGTWSRSPALLLHTIA